jgi:hypothetical protein
MQTIDMMVSLYQDSVPIRFGIIMYSSRFINVVEGSDGTLTNNDGEDTSILVIISIFLTAVFEFFALINGTGNLLYIISYHKTTLCWGHCLPSFRSY